jgi:hypothetical protein
VNAFALSFLLLNAAALLAVPRRWAALPLLVGACYMTLSQGINVGPFSFTVIRILVAVGFVRALARGERLAGGMNGLDWLMLAWAACALISSVFHEQASSSLVLRLGLAYNYCGIYFLLRVFCQSLDDVVSLCVITAIVLVPVAIEMVSEKLTGHNLFSALGGVPASPVVREGRIRAQGPFGHSILAGTVGAVSLPIVIALRGLKRREGNIGIVACLTMVFASASSGPIMTTLAGGFGLFMWRFRDRMRMVRRLAVLSYVGLSLVMTAPAYFIIARIDVVGGSTGYHRAKLIQSAFEHLGEWWLGGTDYTRHWMPTGVPWSPDHTDITNQYLKMGVLGGLPLMLMFIAMLLTAFAFVGQALKQVRHLKPQVQFMIWALGASLFAHAATCISVSYFDQSFVILCLALGVISSVRSIAAVKSSESGRAGDSQGVISSARPVVAV